MSRAWPPSATVCARRLAFFCSSVSVSYTHLSSVRARIHQTILFRFHFWISVAMIVMWFPPFMVPIIKGKPCHNLAEKKIFKKSSAKSQSFRKYDGKCCSSFKDTVCRDGSFMDAYQFLSNGEEMCIRDRNLTPRVVLTQPPPLPATDHGSKPLQRSDVRLDGSIAPLLVMAVPGAARYWQPAVSRSLPGRTNQRPAISFFGGVSLFSPGRSPRSRYLGFGPF